MASKHLVWTSKTCGLFAPGQVKNEDLMVHFMFSASRISHL
jgi:hypothetical protein